MIECRARVKDVRNGEAEGGRNGRGGGKHKHVKEWERVSERGWIGKSEGGWVGQREGRGKKGV